MIRIQTPGKDRLSHIQELYLTAFPANERKPFSLILEKEKQGHMQVLSLENKEGEFIGLAIFIFHGDLALLDYFAITASLRGKGYGSAALQALKCRFPGKRFLLEIESTDDGEENLFEKHRRKAFYLRGGMHPQPYRVRLFGVPMEILTDGSAVSFDEYHEIFGAVFSEKAARQVQKL